MDSELSFKSFVFSEFPKRKNWAVLIQLFKSLEVLFFTFLQKLALYRPKKTIVCVPSLATKEQTFLQAVVFNGTHSEVLGYRPRRILRRLLKGVPDLEAFETIEFKVIVDDREYTATAQTEIRGFVQAQVKWDLCERETRSVWLKLIPKGVKTFFGNFQLGDYEILSQPVFPITEQVKWILVSDIDDTIKDSQVDKTTHWKQILKSIFKGHYYRYEPIQGMADLYQRLSDSGVLIIYLTSTPMQLAPFLMKFLTDNRFPLGPVFLRWLGYGRNGHKWRAIKKITQGMSHQKLIFIGDSGEQDLEIYRRAYESLSDKNVVEKILIRHLPGTVRKTTQGKEAYFQNLADLSELLRQIGVEKTLA